MHLQLLSTLTHYSFHMYNRPNGGRPGSFRRPVRRFPSNGGGGRRMAPPSFHASTFIKKAVPVVEAEAYIPKHEFNDFAIDDRIKQNVARRGYKTPTPIQDMTIEPILAGKDVIGIANTGTGKTAAFVLPILSAMLKDRNLRCLIMIPTRELAQQIQQELRLFSQGLGIYSSLCIGGTSIRQQVYELRRNPHFIIATPGRLKDLVEHNNLKLSNFGVVVLDEVDRMLDMGFIVDIKYLVSLLPQQRQSLFFSATMNRDIESVMHSFLKDPIKISVKTTETKDNVEQDVIRVSNGAMKVDILSDLLKKEDFKKVLIFGRTKHGVEKLSRLLYSRGFRVASIHGNKTQSQRSQAIRMFKEDVVKILVATDVASRGIDINDITHVINYDQPATYEDYVHRIGRTGRANKAGTALTFVE